MVDKDSDYFISLLLKQFLLLVLFLKWLGLDLDKPPDIVLGDVARVIGTARDFVEKFAFGKFDSMRMQIIFCFEVAKNDTVVDRVGRALGVDLMKGLIKDFQLVLFHFHDAAHKDLAVFVGEAGYCVVKVLAERGVDV